MKNQSYNYYLCREVPENYVDIACQDKLPTESWDEWYAIGRDWPVILIMKSPSFTKRQHAGYWTNDWVYRVQPSGKHFYLHMVDREDYDLMDAFGIPHLNHNGNNVTDALGWEEAKLDTSGS